MTRFGENSPFWHILKSLGHIFEGLFSIWRNIGPKVAIFFTIGQVFNVVDGQILKNILGTWSHCLLVKNGPFPASLCLFSFFKQSNSKLSIKFIIIS